MHLIALLYVIRSLFICTFVKLYHICEQSKLEQFLLNINSLTSTEPDDNVLIKIFV